MLKIDNANQSIIFATFLGKVSNPKVDKTARGTIGINFVSFDAKIPRRGKIVKKIRRINGSLIFGEFQNSYVLIFKNNATTIGHSGHHVHNQVLIKYQGWNLEIKNWFPIHEEYIKYVFSFNKVI